MSPRSPISASMYEAQQQQDSETEYTDDEEEEAENTAGTDPEYYNRLMVKSYIHFQVNIE